MTSQSSRRDSLQVAAAAIATTATTIPARAQAEPHPDAELQRLGDEFTRLAAEIDAMEEQVLDLDLDDPRHLVAEAQTAPLYRKMQDLEKQIFSKDPQGLLGLSALAAIAARGHVGTAPNRIAYPGDKALHLLIRIVLRLAGRNVA